MAKALALIASALCFLAVAAHAHDDMVHAPAVDDYNLDKFCVEGFVYCDGCRVLFPAAGGNIGQAVVELSCRDRDDGTPTLTIQGKTDNVGYYAINVNKDHENDICDVQVVSSPEPDCNIIVPAISTTRINLARNSGIITASRFANPIGFMRKEALPECHDVLDSMGFIPAVN
ncbi:hypothetical protein Vadar_027998 [Vaccinium darrowii]|uniref:Uncharacterized protein n=1 Tax=Vaccinium darrowii TaxID=229202 RepID=A0ACB7XTZ4_9ERIC|nr:hypothetical protein Vadar_027998 [Vaccinium darrowii]